ncbi:uncharacterized protein LOC143074950 isoform X1 [Mytilus galloprovincialis]|uniref:uncharacterized protein LOC143074950 isoform X1 n=2 Tax=Mytilus galloprovincialis TaxID=29158 RepID=UPI003F7C2B52
MCDLGQSSDWCYLPDVALIEVYKYLDDSERVAAARVCKNWLRLFETPLLWRYRCVSFGGFDAMGTAERACRYIKRFGKHLRSLAIRFQGPTYRTVKVISQATEVFLKKLAVIANMRLKEFTLYHANMENHWHFVASKNRVVASLCRFLRRCRELEVLNLIAARVTLVDGCRILESLGRGAASKTLKFLYMEDMFQTNVIPISISRYRNAMSKMKGLTYIYTNYNTVNGEILRHFAREQKMKTFTLTIDCDINSWVIEPETWTYFKRQCPDTKVIFYIYASGFRHGIQHALPETVPMKEIDIIAWPAIVESRAEAQTRLCGLIHHISNVYSDTLESFSLHLDKNQPVDDEILYFLGRCYRLKHLSLFCKMSVNTVEKICQMQYDKQLNLRSLNLGVLGLDETELKYLMTVRVQLTQAISQSNNNVVITSELESDDDEESMEEESEEEEENEEDVLEDEDEEESVEEENGHVLGNLDGQANEEQPLAAVVNNEDDGNEEGNENNEESNQDGDENGHIIGNLDGQSNAEQPREVVNNEDEGNEDEEENENNEENNEIVEAIENEEGDESNGLLVQHDEVEDGNQNDVEVNNENDGEVNNGNQDENNLNEGNAMLDTENIDGGNVDDEENVEQYNEEENLTSGQQEIRTIIGHNSLNGENGEPQHIEDDRTNTEHNYGMSFDQYYENISVIEDVINYDTENIGIDEQSNMQEINSYPGETSRNNDRDSSTGHCVGYVEVFYWENSRTRAREDFHGVDNEVSQYFPWEDIETDGVQDRGGLNAENNDENGDNIDNEGNDENSEEINRESVEINDEHGPSDVEPESFNNADDNDIDERGVDEGICHNDDEGNNEINVENIGHDDENIDHENDNIDHEDDIHDGIDDSDINDDDPEDDEADETDHLDENDDENEGDDEGDEEDEDSVDDIFAQLMAETDDEEEDEDYDVVLMEDRSEDDESTEYEDEGDDENDDRSINEAETTDEEL